MAEIPRAVWAKASMEAAMKLLDARSRLEVATADVEAAEAELLRLTGQSHSIDLQGSSYRSHFECEGPSALKILDDEALEVGIEDKPGQKWAPPPRDCRRVVELWNNDVKTTPKICADCTSALADLRRDIAVWKNPAAAAPPPPPPAPPEPAPKASEDIDF